MFDFRPPPLHPADVPGPRVSGGQVLYLDFDGVLHPEDVWLLARGGRPFVKSPEGRETFEHVELLAQLLRPYPDLKIVLSTSWAVRFRYARARDFLPAELAVRCIGSTFHSGMDVQLFRQRSRGQQVRSDVARRRPSAWLALDDTDEGWSGVESHVVLTHEVDGIGDPATRARLEAALARFVGTA